MYKQIQFKIKGMNRDLSESAFNAEYSYENMNIRITATTDNTMLSVSNEKGNVQSEIIGIPNNKLVGIPIGQIILGNELVIFTTIVSANVNQFFEKDKIYKLWFENNELHGKILFSGNAGFDVKYPIEGLPFYESERVKKIYWVDGINQPRVINIADDKEINKDADIYNFVRKVSLNEDIKVTRNTEATGLFAPGTIQYLFTYYNKFSQETSIIHTTPLHYISYKDRGGSADGRISNSFTITIDNIDDSFDFLRIYSIQRTSINTTPAVKRVIDLSTNTAVLDLTTKTKSITFIDNGTSGDTVDPSLLLYLGGKNIIASTISQKDNTLFLGNLELKDHFFSSNEENTIKAGCTISTSYKTLPYEKAEGFYPYENQLNYDSRKIKGFKGNETYRIAIQFQNENGSYSLPVWLGDVLCDKYPEISRISNSIKIPQFTCTIKGLKDLLDIYKYKKARLLMAVPNSTDKSVLCQGIINPTVYNLADRCSNAPFSTASWFMRPDSLNYDPSYNLEYRHNKPLPGNNFNNGEIQNTYKPSSPYVQRVKEEPQSVSISFIYKADDMTTPEDTPPSYFIMEIRRSNGNILPEKVKESTYTRAKEEALKLVDASIIPDEEGWKKGSTVTTKYTPKGEDQVNKFISNEGNNYYIDQSIITFNSPEIEDLQLDLDNTNLKMRIIGIAEVTSTMTDHNILTSSPKRCSFCEGEVDYIKDIPNPNIENKPLGLINAPLWNDNYKDSKEEILNDNVDKTVFVTYPWHRNGPLNNDSNTDQSKRTAVLKRKVFSNLRYCYYTNYFKIEGQNRFWESKFGITPVAIFNSNELTNIRIKKPVNSDLTDINYYGNVDKIVNYNFHKNKKGYPIQCVGILQDDSIYSSFKSDYVENGLGKDPVSIKYKSTPHAVIAFNYTDEGKQVILPSLNNLDSFNTYGKDSNIGVNPWNDKYPNTLFLDFFSDTYPSLATKGQLLYHSVYKKIFIYVGTGSSSWKEVLDAFNDKTLYVFKDKSYVAKEVVQSDWRTADLLAYQGNIYQENLGLDIESVHPFFWIAELYRDMKDVPLYGGNTKGALINNNWIPISDDFDISDEFTIDNTEGDTYFQRWDCLKTYAFTNEDLNSIVDITSFMLETRINIDGRYDRNRGQKNSTVMSPINFNLLNTVYSQSNNFFNYRMLDDKFSLNSFPCSITWSLTKQAVADTDNWTNITMANTLDLDGDKGPVNAIRRYNNTLIAFQDTGISNILYNENVQIASTTGVPIEIANSAKVQGKRYISDKIGSTNKWSICETPSGLFFIDDITKAIYLFNGQLSNVSDNKGFHSWVNTESKSDKVWNPETFDNIVTYYDKANGEVLFITDKQCLAYSELFNNFSSFYSYEHTPYILTLQDKGLSFKYDGRDTLVWLQNQGDYNMFFGKYKPFYVTYLANPDPTLDKIFNTVEFRADSFIGNNLTKNTFDKLKVWNEYQEGESNLDNIINHPSSLKKKYRIWRANIPRDKVNIMNRMRNPWLYIKLSKVKENTERTILHDVVVNYFE